MAAPPTFTPIPFRAAAPGEGYFEDDSPIRIVSRELIVAFSGARALLLQAAHPVMFEGFYDRTTGMGDPHRRLARTATVMNTIYFGRREDADAQTERVRRVHSRINGVLPEPAGRFPAGTPYAADDPHYLLWTLAPLFESAELIYRLYVGGLDRDERDALWQDFRVVGRLFGLADDEMPRTIEDFDDYYAGMFASGDLWVTPRAAELGKAVVFNPPAPLYMRWLVEAVNFVVIGSLPPKIRRGYGLSWDPAREVMRRGGAEYVKRVLLPLLPTMIRNTPVAGGRLLPGPPRAEDDGPPLRAAA
ncbi:MAG: oxygenase MpaB family protein [Solirubrobacteraceae bacterium]